MKLLILAMVLVGALSLGASVETGEEAPGVTLKTHEGKGFDLKSRTGKWTVLYFYPKADTPGCTKQACAFRDNIKKITSLGAEVYGVSVDTVKDQKAFHDKHKLNFTLLADSEGKVTEAFGVKMEGRDLAKRWTFIIDPNLKVAAIEKDVDPVMDALNVAKKIETLKKQ